jgi:hypothetical protein
MNRFALLAAAALLAAPSLARADGPPAAERDDAPAAHPRSSLDDDAAEAGPRYPPTSTRYKLVAGGLGVTGAAYGISFAFAAGFPEVPGSDKLKIPIAGPWMALGQSGCASDDPSCGGKVVLRGFFLVLDGIAQLAGLGLIAESILIKTEGPSPKKSAPTFEGFRVRPFPVVSAQMTGVGLVGTF